MQNCIPSLRHLLLLMAVGSLLMACTSQPPIAANDASSEPDTTAPADVITTDAQVAVEACESDESCADSIGELSVCMQARCDLFSGLCIAQPRPNGLGCDDTNPCTSNDFCNQGVCSGGVMVACDDENPCTEDICTTDVGCSYTPIEVACEDGDPCTTAEQCKDGACVASKATDCDDANPCTTDACDGMFGCVHQPTPGESCDDQNACTTASQCTVSGSCEGIANLVCDDQDVCTKDTCDPLLGCQSIQTNAPCNDGDSCTENDSCAQGMCTGTPLDCNDQDGCTVDECLPETGCAHTAFEGECDDQDPCTSDDICGAAGLCTGVPVDCDDGNNTA